MPAATPFMPAATPAKVQPAHMADAAALSAFAQASFAETFSYRGYPPADLAAFFNSYMSADIFAKYIASADQDVHIARDESGAIQGFMRSGPVTLPLPAGHDANSGLELHQLYLAPQAKGTGLAQNFMALLFDRAETEGAQALYLSVYCENIRAQRFYAKYGFAEIGSNPFWVGNVCDDDRIWMRAI
jgi:diamine N-acetyltransferase